ncbi:MULTISPECIES: hypothetical protein [Agromyces]|jgi:hypothetical protein|uniref:hypothetical protein n=1 Tax=Agromyces TaxID=33877 RepID=UPI002040B2CF|nr:MULTISPECIES: hypothetical protein [Agromyces]MCM3658217.1 hypothetical protein [Agromyces mediolanus]GLU88057.1 hypothetical protein Agsp01_03120 [Agromyces sp. NBRC 114283]
MGGMHRRIGESALVAVTAACMMAFANLVLVGAAPTLVGFALSVAFSAAAYGVFRGRSFTISRALLGVVASQLVFHAFFRVGEGVCGASFIVEGNQFTVAAALWVPHVVASVVTAAYLGFGNHLTAVIAAAVRRLAHRAWCRLPRVLTPDTRQVIECVPRPLRVRWLGASVRRRGPPVVVFAL